MASIRGYEGPGEVWAPDDKPRQCRRWNKAAQAWQWKARFETREKAAEGPGKGSLLYVCDECGFWHRASDPSKKAVEVALFQGETVTGLWCHQCNLPSGTLLTIHVGSPDSGTTKTIVRCEEDGNHVLIEEQAAHG